MKLEKKTAIINLSGPRCGSLQRPPDSLAGLAGSEGNKERGDLGKEGKGREGREGREEKEEGGERKRDREMGKGRGGTRPSFERN